MFLLFADERDTTDGLVRGLPGAPFSVRRWNAEALAWERLGLAASYVVGAVASYWVIDRVVGFWA